MSWRGTPLWTLAAPVLALLAALVGVAGMATVGAVAAGVLLVGAILAAVHHAEVVADRVGEPFGTLVLALSVTVIEVGLIVSVMLSGGDAAPTMARDTVFAAVMVILNGIIGISLLAGGLKHSEQQFEQRGVSSALAVLAVLVVLSLILANFTSSVPGPFYSATQLAFVGVASLVLYLGFVSAQTISHRGYFLTDDVSGAADGGHAIHGPAGVSAVLLLVALVAIVLTGKALAPTIEAAVRAAGLPHAVVGIAVAAIVLGPEGLAAWRAARINRLQTSLNLALGSALASIGLTLPAVAVVALVTGMPVALGIDAKNTVLLALSLFVSAISLSTARTTYLLGLVHLVLFASWLLVTLVP